MALISAIAAVVAFYGPRLTVSKLAAIRRPSIGGSFVYGLIFSLGTSPAPLLLLLSVAAATANPLFGFILALCFSIGRGLPFLVVCLFAGAVTKFAQLTWLRKSIQIVSGLALLFVCYCYIKVFIDLQLLIYNGYVFYDAQQLIFFTSVVKDITANFTPSLKVR